VRDVEDPRLDVLDGTVLPPVSSDVVADPTYADGWEDSGTFYTGGWYDPISADNVLVDTVVIRGR
jgi:hypothetical protein